MKGLLVKDLKLMKNQKNFIVALIIMISVFWMSGVETTFFMGYVPFVFLIFTMSTISYDEMDNGLSFLMVLPVSRKDYVKEKYLLGMLLGFGGLLVAFVLSAANELWKNHALEYSYWLLLGFSFMGFIILFLCLMIPIQLKYGSDKGRLVLFAIFFSVIGIFYLGNKVMKDLPIDVSGILKLVMNLPLGAMLALALAAFVLAVFLSMGISNHIMEKKEL